METTATLEPIKPTTQLEPATPPIPAPIKVRKKRAPKHDFKDGIGRVFAHRHDNGKGWVADTARVADSAYVGPRAQVFHFAKVRDYCRIEGTATVFGHADISGTATVKHARVFGNAAVRDKAKINDACVVSGNAVVSGDSELYVGFQVIEHAYVFNSMLRGYGTISGHAHIMRSNFRTREFEASGNVTAINATIVGRARLQQYANMLHSIIELNEVDNGEVLLRDFAVICSNTRITAPVEIKNHAVLAHTSLSANHFNNDWRGRERLVIRNNMMIGNRAFTSYTALESFLINGDTPPPPPQVPGFPARVLPNGSPSPRPPVIVAPINRRIMNPENALS